MYLKRSIPYVVTLAFLPLACTKYSVRIHPAKADVMKLPGARVALLGFYPFAQRVTGSRYAGDNRTITTYEAYIAYNRGFKQMMPYGKDVRQFPVVGKRQISKEEFSRVSSLYLSRVRRSGQAEILQLLAAGEGGKYYRKVRDVDYYIIATHGPAFSKVGELSVGRDVINTLALFSLGLYPRYIPYRVSSDFIVLDRNLKLVRIFGNAGEFWVRKAWFGSGDPAPGFTAYESSAHKASGITPHPRAVEADILSFAREFARFHKSRGGK